CGTHDNIASADGSNTDPAVGGDSITVECVPVLVVEKTPDGGSIVAGDMAEFTIQVTNNGPGTATNVTLNDTLPGDMTWTDNSDSCTIAQGNVLSCSFGNLAQGASASVTVSAATDSSDCGLLDNQDATAQASNAAPVTDDGDITVSCDVTVDLDKTNDADDDGTFTDSEIAPSEGSDVPFQLVITNTSDVPVVITTLTDEYPGTAAFGICADLLGMTLQPGGSVTCTFTLTGYAPPANGSITNTARTVVVDASDETRTASDFDTSTVTSPEVLPRIFRRPPPPGDVVRPAALAFTGAPMVVLAALAALMLLLGVGLSAMSRRRRNEGGSA
ncbi:MAG TPA: hypothetical protein VEA19_01675, partial [Actinomycetota bacterium]|nr:hypothetical protein [Actinomycetota bacterium]